MHQMGRLYNQVLNAIVNGTLKSLIHVVDLLVITSLDMVDNDLSGECTSYRPVRIMPPARASSMPLISAARLSLKEVPKLTTRSSFSPISSPVARIVLGSVAGVASEVLRS